MWHTVQRPTARHLAHHSYRDRAPRPEVAGCAPCYPWPVFYLIQDLCNAVFLCEVQGSSPVEAVQSAAASAAASSLPAAAAACECAAGLQWARQAHAAAHMGRAGAQKSKRGAAGVPAVAQPCSARSTAARTVGKAPCVARRPPLHEPLDRHALVHPRKEATALTAANPDQQPKGGSARRCRPHGQSQSDRAHPNNLSIACQRPAGAATAAMTKKKALLDDSDEEGGEVTLKVNEHFARRFEVSGGHQAGAAGVQAPVAQRRRPPHAAAAPRAAHRRRSPPAGCSP